MAQNNQCNEIRMDQLSSKSAAKRIYIHIVFQTLNIFICVIKSDRMWP